MKTTDPQDEQFDLYDASGNPLGRSKPRGEVHRDGDWHRSLHLWVWSGDRDRAEVIFQRRSMTKDTWAGSLDVSVGGHFRSGETLDETLREAEEEIGLSVTAADVVRLGRRFNTWRAETFYDSEINEVYGLRSDQSLADFRQHPEEIDELVRINVNAALALFLGQVDSVEATSMPRGAGSTQTVQLVLSDFVDMSDDYAVQTLHAIRQLADSETPEPFLIRPSG
ncbi:MAG: NUDIX domain-containing protein [Thermomicrobiales bacterium]